MDMGLQDRVVLVTGSSRGIGQATAVAFGREGARVAVTYNTNRAGAEDTAAMVERVGGETMVIPYDLTDDTSIEAAAHTLVERWGTIEVLVNNARQRSGSMGSTGGPLFEHVPPDQWRTMIRSTLEGIYLTIQTVLPSMRSRGWGRIVNISSTVAEDGQSGSGPYAAAKAGLHGLTRTLAVELAPAGILTNTVLPGLTLTGYPLPQEVLDRGIRETPTGRITTSEDVAATVVFLGSGANGHINGELIRVAGGLRLAGGL